MSRVLGSLPYETHPLVCELVCPIEYDDDVIYCRETELIHAAEIAMQHILDNLDENSASMNQKNLDRRCRHNLYRCAVQQVTSQ